MESQFQSIFSSLSSSLFHTFTSAICLACNLFARFAASRSPIHMYTRAMCVRIHTMKRQHLPEINEMNDSHTLTRTTTTTTTTHRDNDGDDEARETEKTAADLKIKCYRANKDKWRRSRGAMAGSLARAHILNV